MSSGASKINEVIIRKEWDYLPHIDDLSTTDSIIENQQDNRGTVDTEKYRKNCHVGRKEESEYLIDFFRRRKEGSLLISGKRGVGKTSVVTSAILATQQLAKVQIKDDKQKVSELIRKEEILPVLVNAPNFEIRKLREDKLSGSEKVNFLEFKRLVMQNLVRALYQATLRKGIVDRIELDNIPSENKKNPKKISFRIWRSKNQTSEQDDAGKSKTEYDLNLRNKIYDLFRRAVAKDIVTQSNLKGLESEKFAQIKESAYELSWPNIVTTMVASISIGAASLFALPLLGVPELAAKAIAIVSSVVPPVVTMSWTLKKTRTDLTESEKNASICYMYDYDLTTLQSELEETILRLTDSGFKVIFIIDELDKIDESDVMEVTKSLKSLFNSASALFVLITGPEFFNKVSALSEGRGKEYTLFSQKLFIRRPRFSELKKFMDLIVDPKTSSPIIKLFEWQELGEQERFGTMLDRHSVYDEELGKLRDAQIMVNKQEAIISVEKDGDVYDTSIKNIDTEPDAILKIMDSGKHTEFEFGVLTQNGTSYVYTRTAPYRDFQHYAGYQSKGDFFDVYNVIRDHLYYENYEKPRLNIQLEPEQLVQARLNSIMTAIYAKVEYSHPSEWDKNDRLLSLMYDFIIKFSELRGTASRVKIEKTPFRIVFLDDNNNEVDSIPGHSKNENK